VSAPGIQSKKVEGKSIEYPAKIKRGDSRAVRYLLDMSEKSATRGQKQRNHDRDKWGGGDGVRYGGRRGKSKGIEEVRRGRKET
jgi:hypothetical protein